MQGFVAYYRVSTDRQDQSGLGLDAQRSAVAGFVGARELVAEFTEIESGKRTDRPQLAAALELAVGAAGRGQRTAGRRIPGFLGPLDLRHGDVPPVPVPSRQAR
jgi:hypothetical protein